MRNFRRNVLLFTCLLTLQMINPAKAVYAKGMTLEYDGKKHIYNNPPITLQIEGKKVDTPIMPPIQIDSRTLVPSREVFEPMGAFVEWKPSEKKAYVNYEDTLMVLEVDQQDVWINGKIAKLDVPAKLINNKLMLPLRFIGETLGFTVDWDGKTRNINIHQEKLKPEPGPIPTPKPGEGQIGDSMQNVATLPTSLFSKPLVWVGDMNEKQNGLASIQMLTLSQTEVSSVQVHNIDNASSTYTIHFNQPVGTFTSFEDKGKLVVDIVDAKNLLSSSITLPNNPYVQTVRSSQFTADTTRVVFDLKAGASSYFELSADRTALTITMNPMPLTSILVGQNEIGDFITIPNISKAQVSVSTITNPDRLVIDIPMAAMNNIINWSKVDGQYIQGVRSSSTAERVRIVLDMKAMPYYEVVEKTNELHIQLSKPAYKNIAYTSLPQHTLVFKKVPGLSINQVNVKDDYRNSKIIVTLPSNYQHVYGYGTMNIGSDIIDKVEIQSGSQTQFTIYEKKIQAFNVIDDGENIQIVFMSPREKYNKIVVLDAGHGDKDPGAVANGLQEKRVNIEQAMHVYRLLEKDSSIKVYITREDDSYPTNPFRAQLANEIGADIFISMHNNAFTPQHQGTEVLYYPNQTDTKSKQAAQIVQKNMTSQLGTKDRGIKARPDLIVLNSTKMPAILIETAFLTNAEDVARLKSPEFNEKVGQVVYQSIIEIFNTLSFR